MSLSKLKSSNVPLIFGFQNTRFKIFNRDFINDKKDEFLNKTYLRFSSKMIRKLI